MKRFTISYWPEAGTMAVQFVEDTKTNEFIRGYKPHNPLLNPLYDKVNEIKKDLLLGDCPECPHTIGSSYLRIDIDSLNSESDDTKIQSVKRFLGYVNDGTLSQHLSEPDVVSTINLLYQDERKMPKEDFIKALFALSDLKPKLSLETGGGYRITDNSEVNSFSIEPSIGFRYITPEHIAIHGDEFIGDADNADEIFPVFSVVDVKGNKDIENVLLEPQCVHLTFIQLMPDWVHSGNDAIMYIESKKIFASDAYLSDVGATEFHKHNVNDEESRIKQTDERSVFLKWLKNPEITAFNCMYPFNEKKALENCFISIINRLGWQFEDLKPDDLQDSLTVLSRKGKLEYNYSGLYLNDEPLYMRRTSENKIEFIADDKVICVTKFK